MEHGIFRVHFKNGPPNLSLFSQEGRGCYAVLGAVLRHFWLCAIPWTVAHPAPLSMGFSRQEYCSGLPCPPPGDLPHPGIQPRSPALQADSLPPELPGKPREGVPLELSVPSSALRRQRWAAITVLPSWVPFGSACHVQHWGKDGNPLQCSWLENQNGQRSPVGYSPWGHKASDMTEHAIQDDMLKTRAFDILRYLLLGNWFS